MPHHDTPPRPSDTPVPGFFRVRLCKGGPWVPARILHEDDHWLVVIDGVATSEAAHRDPWKAPRMEMVAFSNAITAAEYASLLEQRRALPEDHPLKDATKPIDMRAAGSLYRRT